MDFRLTSYNAFIAGSPRAPMSREEYQATTRPVSGMTRNLAGDTVDFSSSPGRQSLINALGARFGGSGHFNLVNTLIPSRNTLGFSTGLYAGVGELPAHKVKSLINKYV